MHQNRLWRDAQKMPQNRPQMLRIRPHMPKSRLKMPQIGPKIPPNQVQMPKIRPQKPQNRPKMPLIKLGITHFVEPQHVWWNLTKKAPKQAKMH